MNLTMALSMETRNSWSSFFETISGKQGIIYATKLKTVLAIQQ